MRIFQELISDSTAAGEKDSRFPIQELDWPEGQGRADGGDT